MILYSAKYRLPGDLCWRRVRRIKDDLLLEKGKQVLVLEDETQVHLPLDAVVVFHRRRFESIRRKMEAEAGQPMTMRQGS